MRLLYSALWWMVLPLALLRLWWRGRKEPGYRQHIGERLGFYDHFAGKPASPIIWIHAVSVGETRAAQPLMEALLRAYPKHTMLLTHMTATGRTTGQQLFAQHGNRVVQSYFPYDTGWICGRFLRYFQPKISILMETEVWPNMVRQCVRHHVPIMLANARLSERSLRRGRRFGSVLLEAASSINCVAAQSEEDATRLRLFGAHAVHVIGNLKFDVEVPAEMIELGQRWREQFGNRPVLLCASTREGEERLILDAMKELGCQDFLTIIVPRHPQRFDEVAEMISTRGFSMQRRSEMGGAQLASDISIILGDSMGEMFAYYTACDVAFIGGSLLPLGGQNLIEACSLGKPVLIGLHTFNFQVISEQAIIAGASSRISDASEVLSAAKYLFETADLLLEMSAKAKGFAKQHQGATTRTMTLIKSVLD